MDTQIRPKSPPPSGLDISPDGLNALGFVAVTYPGQFGNRGTYFSAKVPVSAMPDLSRQVDDDVIYADSIVTVELTPDGGVQMVISDTGYSEQYDDAFADEGLGLLQDALAALAAVIPPAVVGSVAEAVQ